MSAIFGLATARQHTTIAIVGARTPEAAGALRGLQDGTEVRLATQPKSILPGALPGCVERCLDFRGRDSAEFANGGHFFVLAGFNPTVVQTPESPRIVGGHDRSGIG